MPSLRGPQHCQWFDLLFRTKQLSPRTLARSFFVLKVKSAASACICFIAVNVVVTMLMELLSQSFLFHLFAQSDTSSAETRILFFFAQASSLIFYPQTALLSVFEVFNFQTASTSLVEGLLSSMLGGAGTCCFVVFPKLGPVPNLFPLLHSHRMPILCGWSRNIVHQHHSTVAIFPVPPFLLGLPPSDCIRSQAVLLSRKAKMGDQKKKSIWSTERRKKVLRGL